MTKLQEDLNNLLLSNENEKLKEALETASCRLKLASAFLPGEKHKQTFLEWAKEARVASGK